MTTNIQLHTLTYNSTSICYKPEGSHKIIKLKTGKTGHNTNRLHNTRGITQDKSSNPSTYTSHNSPTQILPWSIDTVLPCLFLRMVPPLNLLPPLTISDSHSRENTKSQWKQHTTQRGIPHINIHPYYHDSPTPQLCVWKCFRPKTPSPLPYFIPSLYSYLHSKASHITPKRNTLTSANREKVDFDGSVLPFWW